MHLTSFDSFARENRTSEIPKMYDSTIIYSSLICLLVCISNIQTIRYTDLEMLGVDCQDRDSCVHVSSDSEFLSRNCECDNYCSVFDDCCIDAPTSVLYSGMKYTCMEFGGGPLLGAYVIDKCPQSYSGSDDIRTKCQFQKDFLDPLAATPVTSILTRTTYRNRYCAECNGAVPSSLRSWNVLLTCDTLALYNVNESFAWENIQYRTDIKEWGVDYQGEFHFCDILFDLPDYLSSKVRLCRANIVSTCPSTFQNLTMKFACESYTAVVRAKKQGNETFYKNPHCAFCNGEKKRSLNCLLDSLHLRHKQRFSFAMLFDVDMGNGDIVGEVQKCHPEEVYDYFFKKCRPLICILPGRRKVNGKCQKI